MMEREIDPIGFAGERAAEIQLIETAIESNRKKSMMFQRLPFYLRRRPKSHEKRKKRQKIVRKKDRHGLRTHTWYAKRFEMLKVWDTAIPLRRRMKSSKFIYKSQHRGFIFDESYKKVVIYNRPKGEEVLGINFSLEDVVQEVKHSDIIFEAIVTKEHIVTISLGVDELEKILAPILVEHGRIECCLSIIKADGLFSNELDEEATRFSKLLRSRKKKSIDDILRDSPDEVIYVRSLSSVESGKVFLKRTRVLDFWQSALNTGIIPVCVEELQRIALENDYIIYPFDYPNARAYRDFEEAYVEPMKAKYDRTPKSKKMSIDTSSMYIYTEERVVLAMFELEKGSADRCAFILDDDKVVGRVIRGTFCFTKGLCRGVCYTFQDIGEGDELYTKNLNSTSFNQIKITKVLEADKASQSI